MFNELFHFLNLKYFCTLRTCSQFIPYTATQYKLQNVPMCMCACLVGKRKNTTSASCSGRWQHGKSFVHISTLVGARKTPPPQVAGYNYVHSKCKWVFALIDGRKYTTSTSCWGSKPSWALVGAGCSNQLRLAQGHNQPFQALPSPLQALLLRPRFTSTPVPLEISAALLGRGLSYIVTSIAWGHLVPTAAFSYIPAL